MDFGYPSQQVSNVIALWKGNVPGLDKRRNPATFDSNSAIQSEHQRILLQTYKPYWQEAIAKMDASLVSDELILLVPILPCMFVASDAYLKEHPSIPRDTETHLLYYHW